MLGLDQRLVTCVDREFVLSRIKGEEMRVTLLLISLLVYGYEVDLEVTTEIGLALAQAEAVCKVGNLYINGS